MEAERPVFASPRSSALLPWRSGGVDSAGCKQTWRRRGKDGGAQGDRLRQTKRSEAAQWISVKWDWKVTGLILTLNLQANTIKNDFFPYQLINGHTDNIKSCVLIIFNTATGSYSVKKVQKYYKSQVSLQNYKDNIWELTGLNSKFTKLQVVFEMYLEKKHLEA